VKVSRGFWMPRPVLSPLFTNCLEKLSEKGRRGLQHSPTDRSQDLSCSEIRPNPRSKRCSNPFSDSLWNKSSRKYTYRILHSPGLFGPESRCADPMA
jgi:hypothetical protein